MATIEGKEDAIVVYTTLPDQLEGAHLEWKFFLFSNKVHTNTIKVREMSDGDYSKYKIITYLLPKFPFS